MTEDNYNFEDIKAASEKQVAAVDEMFYHFEKGYNKDDKTLLDSRATAMHKVLMEVPLELRAVTFKSFCDLAESQGYPVKASDFLGDL